LSIEFVSDAGKLSQWDAFVRRSRLDTKEINLETVVRVIADFMMRPSIAATEGKAFLLRWTQVGPGKYDDYSLLSVSTSRTMGEKYKTPLTVRQVLRSTSTLLHFPLLVNC
jgi:hypothetical protein